MQRRSNNRHLTLMTSVFTVGAAMVVFTVAASGWAQTQDGANPPTRIQSPPQSEQSPTQGANTAEATIARLYADISVLAADDFEGRGPGTKGIDMAADYIAARFRELGLQTDSYDGTPFQHFELPSGASLGETNTATLQGPEDAERSLELNETFTPLALGGSAKLDMPLAFVGYGITDPDLEYDDYAGLDVRGKAVIVLQGEPQQNDDESIFNGRRNTTNAQDTRKVSNAYQHGAEAVILVQNAASVQANIDRFSRLYDTALDQINERTAEFAELERPTVEQLAEYKEDLDQLIDRAVTRAERMDGLDDPLIPFSTRRRGRGGDEGRNLAVLSMTRGAVNQLFATVGQPSLEELETAIDETVAARSFEFEDWKIVGEVSVTREVLDCKNVVAVLPATEEGPLAEETIVIGAHYDHLGYGGRGSLAGSASDIHNGADDNGSGTISVLELARRLSQQTTRRRRLVFILFSAEERGLIGSTYYANNPLFPNESTVAMINLDMVGKLRDNQLTIRGTGSAEEFDAIIDALNETYAFEITKDPAGEGPSDHASFYRKDIPVLDYFTNTHEDYHRPTDDFDKLNLDGTQRIISMAEEMTIDLVNADEGLTFQTVDAVTQRGNRGNAGRGNRGNRGGAGRGGRGGRRGRGGDGGGDNAADGDADSGTNTDDAGDSTGTDGTTDAPRPWFGAIPDFATDVEGVKLMGTSEGSPAQIAGMKRGDVVVELGGNRIGTLEDLDSALRKFKVGDKIRVVAMRGEEQLVLEVQLDIRPDDGE